MNHLRDLLETINSRGILYETEADVNRVKRKLQPLGKMAEGSMCFYMGDFHDFPNEHSIPEICHLPFRNCWFESDFVNERGLRETLCILVSADSKNESGTQGTILCLCRGGINKPEDWMLLGIGEPIGADLDAALLQQATPWAVWPNTKATITEFPKMFAVLVRFLTLMNCSNISRTENRPDEKLQRARAKRGKKPLFSYWTLELEANRTTGPDLGGTHASPRLHLRRGHPRQYAPGKYTWVQPHVVGNKALGMIHKDYDGSKLMSAGRTLQ